jgi:4-diphosphocytidyl-2-C-methyl-D-erythritol kinase
MANGHDLRLEAPAKINVFLEVLGKRPDGYHELETVMLRTDFCDYLTFDLLAENEVEFTCSDSSLPLDEKNLVVKAARLLQSEFCVNRGCRIHLEKQIPHGAGLGGGSSDAATTIMGLNRLWQLGLSPDQMAALGARLGSDIPFFFYGPAAVCHGRGEIVKTLSLTVSFNFVLFCPMVHCATAEIFRRVRRDGQPMDAATVMSAIESGSTKELAGGLYNRLQEATELFKPELRQIPQLMRQVRPQLLGTLMTGSGSAYFGLSHSRAEAQAVAEELTRLGQGIVRVLTCGP